jgi:hypothetical protein
MNPGVAKAVGIVVELTILEPHDVQGKVRAGARWAQATNRPPARIICLSDGRPDFTDLTELLKSCLPRC